MKCYVKIEAIECFPCYLKISFYYADDSQREEPFSVIRLNIPGVKIGSAASRTKSFAYGIFWKNNRKRCRLFFAFTDKQSCTRHMEWLKKSIDSLENYRKGEYFFKNQHKIDVNVSKFPLFLEILENHRISRSLINEENMLLDTSKNNFSDTLNERALNDILGPLPEIPINSLTDSSYRLSVRRTSGSSGIYEEILEPFDVGTR